MAALIVLSKKLRVLGARFAVLAFVRETLSRALYPLAFLGDVFGAAGAATMFAVLFSARIRVGTVDKVTQVRPLHESKLYF